MPRRILITSALPYVNNEPHLGNIIGCVLSGDVYSRFTKMMGYDSIYVCGTDEYGTATEVKAWKEGVSCREICDKYHAIHKRIYDWFEIDFDVFGRTSTEKQTEITHRIYQQLLDNGFIEKREVEQLWCDELGMYVSDRYVEGICYHDECSSKKSVCRGDQCDACGGLIDAKKLVDPVCVINGEKPVVKKSWQMYLRQDLLQDRVKEYHRNGKTKMTKLAEGITRSWLEKELLPRSITRDLKWGTPVPDTDKVFYVWFDAPIGYLSILAHADDHERYLEPDTEWVQFMAKDNVSFHSVIFPETLLGCTDKYPLVTHLDAVQYLTYRGEKFSKSKGVGVFGTDAIAICDRWGIDADYFRAYLLKIRPEINDSNFEWDGFVGFTNGVLVANIGNYINRTMSMVTKYFKDTELELEPDGAVNDLIEKWIGLMEDCRFTHAFDTIIEISSVGNKFIQDEKPWVLAKEKRMGELKRVLGKAVWIAEVVGHLLGPFLPKKAESILSSIVSASSFTEIRDRHNAMVTEKPTLLFKMLDLEEVNAILAELGIH